MKLRLYQTQAVKSVLREFETKQSTLCVCPTGCGKTIILSEVARQLNTTDDRTLVIAHREELLTQAKGTIEDHTGLDCEMELGEQKASEIFPARVLLASVQTMTSGRNGARRMHKFSPFNYGLIVVDEYHHAVSPSYRAVVDYMKSNEDIKILGVTATPKRADKQGLGQICESVAFEYSIQDAIKDGWLVPIQQQLVNIQDLDFSHIRTTAGDLNASDLAAVMEAERNLYGVCDATIKELGNQKAIMFCVTVRQAEMCCDILNRYRPGMAVSASGKTPKDIRRRIIRDYREGKYQVFVNCDLVGEGFDMPEASLLVDAVPTKSITRYTQRLGRIMRPLSGIVDDLESGHVTTLTEKGGDASCYALTDGLSENIAKFHQAVASNAALTFDPATRRRRAIADSGKSVATVLDFVGNAGRHKLVHAIDVLGGKISPRARELAERELRTSGRPEKIDELIMEAERREDEERRLKDAARKARITVNATYTKKMIDPFAAFDLVAPPYRAWDSGKSLSEKQRALLRRHHTDPDTLTYSQGKTILNTMFDRWKRGMATLKQCATLKRFGVDTSNMTMAEASENLNQLAANGWKR